MGLYTRHHLAIRKNSPFYGLLYTQLEVIALYSQEHNGNYPHTECISSRVNKIGTLLIGFVHFYGTAITIGVNGLKKYSLSKRTSGGGGGPLRLSK